MTMTFTFMGRNGRTRYTHSERRAKWYTQTAAGTTCVTEDSQGRPSEVQLRFEYTAWRPDGDGGRFGDVIDGATGLATGDHFQFAGRT